MKALFKLCWLLLPFGLATAFHVEAAVLFQDNFSTSSGEWSQFNGSFSLAGGKYSITGASDGRATAFAGNTTWQDYTFEVDANLIAPKVTEGFDVLFHVQSIGSGTDNGHYYQFTARRNGKATLYEINSPGSGTRVLASGTNPTYRLNSWHHLKVEIHGQTAIAYLDDVPFLTYDSLSDYTFGGIGLKSFGGDTVLYDNVLVTALPDLDLSTPTPDPKSTPAPETQTVPTPAERIQAIKKLLDKGEIKQDEYERQVREILDAI